MEMAQDQRLCLDYPSPDKSNCSDTWDNDGMIYTSPNYGAVLTE